MKFKFLVVKFSIYLNRRVFVMGAFELKGKGTLKGMYTRKYSALENKYFGVNDRLRSKKDTVV